MSYSRSYSKLPSGVYIIVNRAYPTQALNATPAGGRVGGWTISDLTNENAKWIVSNSGKNSSQYTIQNLGTQQFLHPLGTRLASGSKKEPSSWSLHQNGDYWSMSQPFPGATAALIGPRNGASVLLIEGRDIHNPEESWAFIPATQDRAELHSPLNSPY